MPSLSRTVILLACVLPQITPGYCQGGPPKAHPRREDVKYIGCEVCRHLADAAFVQVEQLFNERGKKVKEAAVIDLVERLTTAWRPEGSWIASLFLEVTSGGKIGVRSMGKAGECEEACKTVELAAQKVMGEHDTDIAEALYMRKFKSKKELDKWICSELTDACTSKAPSLPKGHQAYPLFKPMAADGQNIDRVLGEMADSGLRGKVWSKEELMERYKDELGTDPELKEEL